MSYHTEESIDSNILDDIITRYLPDGFNDEHLSMSNPFLDEFGSYQQNSNPFSILSVHQDYVSLPQGVTDLTPIIHSQPSTSIEMQSPSFPFIDQRQQYGDIFLTPQAHILQNQEHLEQNCCIPLLLNTDPCYELDGNSKIPIPDFVGGFEFEPEGAMDSLLPSTVEQVDPRIKTAQSNQILASTETYNTKETNGGNSEATKISSSYEFNVQRVEVARQRVHWTKELHECFVQAVDGLGGPDRTTPRSILIKMGVDGLTIDQVKSHLQKHRYITRQQSEAKEDKASCSEGKKKNATGQESKVTKVSTKDSGTLQMQWELQKTLHDQLKVIRELQLQTEKSGRQLQEFLENQNKMRETLQASQSSSLKSKDSRFEEPSAQACSPVENKALPNQDNIEEDDCYIIETNFDFATPVHKKVRVHSERINDAI